MGLFEERPSLNLHGADPMLECGRGWRPQEKNQSCGLRGNGGNLGKHGDMGIMGVEKLKHK